MQQQTPPQMDFGRNRTVANTARVLEASAEWIARCYPLIAHTRDFLVQVGRFAPDEEVRGPCPIGLVRIATVCRGLGSGLRNVALCVEGTSGICAVLGAGLRCLNNTQGVGAGLDQAGQPEKIIVKTKQQLEKIIIKWEKSGDPVELDVDSTSTVEFAKTVETFLKPKGAEALALIEDGENYKTRLAQHSKMMSLMLKHPLPKGVADALASSAPTTSPTVPCDAQPGATSASDCRPAP